MDDAGENKMLMKSCDQNEIGIKFEYTAPGMLEALKSPF